MKYIIWISTKTGSVQGPTAPSGDTSHISTHCSEITRKKQESPVCDILKNTTDLVKSCSNF